VCQMSCVDTTGGDIVQQVNNLARV